MTDGEHVHLREKQPLCIHSYHPSLLKGIQLSKKRIFSADCKFFLLKVDSFLTGHIAKRSTQARVQAWNLTSGEVLL